MSIFFCMFCVSAAIRFNQNHIQLVYSIFFSWSIFIHLRKMPKAKAKTIRKDAEEAPEKPKKRKGHKKKKTAGKCA